jgi:hypothetical protein
MLINPQKLAHSYMRDMAMLTKALLEIEEGGRVFRLCGFG